MKEININFWTKENLGSWFQNIKDCDVILERLVKIKGLEIFEKCWKELELSITSFYFNAPLFLERLEKKLLND
jgi:hypothetical protein